MKAFQRIFFFSAFILLPFYSLAQQDINAHSPAQKSGSRQQKIADKKKLKQQQLQTKAIEKGKKQHEKNQSKQTKKMMRKSKKTSKRWNEDKK